jgi:LAO/AO transport system kinase
MSPFSDRLIAQYVDEILQGDKIYLSKAITLLESQHIEDRSIGLEILEKVMPFTKKSIRIAITGAPGVGKSSFIEIWGNHLLETHSQKLAVLAIDPSSQTTQGSILGDKTRMQTLSKHKRAYIRPSPAGQTLGGVTAHTRECVLLCEAAGYDLILIETVGVGQSEIAARSMVDFFLLLVLPGSGDELQGLKRGIVEVADWIAISKADGENKIRAEQAESDYKNALHLYTLPESGWQPGVSTCSSFTGYGLDLIETQLKKYVALTQSNGYWDKQRQDQHLAWMREIIDIELKNTFLQKPAVQHLLPLIEQDVLHRRISPIKAARQLLGLK